MLRKKKCQEPILLQAEENVLCYISTISQPIAVKFCRLLRLTQLSDLNHIKPNQTKLIQTKPNSTIFHIKANFSTITHQIFMKFGMVFWKTYWHVNMQSLSWSVHACINGMHKCACKLIKYVCSSWSQWKICLIRNLCKQKMLS